MQSKDVACEARVEVHCVTASYLSVCFVVFQCVSGQ